ncbi:MAG: hypothetical protein DLM60_16640 [Pseudonocardiales bacterium]|nr:MAG: hypothetical protein DLM60_16640 [Pseudonocardiales bacterium]
MLTTGSRSWTDTATIPDVPTQMAGAGGAAVVPGSCASGVAQIAETIWATPPSLVPIAPRH